jgi:hypothetical protein
MPRRAGRSQSFLGGLLLVVFVVLPHPAFPQEPAVGEKPGAPGQQPGTPGQPGTPPPAPGPAQVTPATPETQPVPVIPDTQLIPTLTIPSAPQRLLPAPAFRALPTARFQLDPTLTLSEEYTDNFNLTERDKESNFRSTVAPGLALTINSAFVKGLVSYNFAPSYDTASDEVSLFHSLLGQILWEATPLWKLTLADTFTRSDAPGEADRLGLRQQRQAFTSNTLLLASDYLLLGTVATRQSYQMAKFSSEEGDETTAHTLALSATVPLGQTNSVTGGYEYLISNSTNGTTSTTSGASTTSGTSGDFEVTGHKVTAGATRKLTTLRSVGITSSYALRTVTSGNSETDFTLWNAAVFTDYVLPRRLTLSGSLGVSALSADSGVSVGPNLSTKSTLSYQFARAMLSLSVDKGFSETFAEGENFGVVETEGVTGSLSYPFTPSITGTLTGNYRRNKTVDIGDTSLGTQQDQESENWGGTLSFSWRVRPGLLVELSYTYHRQVGSESNNRQNTTGSTGAGSIGFDNSYTENRVKASVNLSF